MVTKETSELDFQGAAQDSEESGRMLSRRALIKIGWTVPVVAMTVTPSTVFATCSTQNGDGTYDSCTRTQGYYRTHEEWVYENGNLIGGVEDIGSSDFIARATAIDIMNTASPYNYIKGDDVRLLMFRQLVAAKVNYLRETPLAWTYDGKTYAGTAIKGQTYQLLDIINKANTWFTKSSSTGWIDTDNPYAVDSDWTRYSIDGLNAEGLKDLLDNYNNKYSCR